MAQNTILATGSAAATSSDVVVAAGSVVSVGIYSAAGIPHGVSLSVMMDTPGLDTQIGELTARSPALILSGPGTYRVVRSALAGAVSVGAYSET